MSENDSGKVVARQVQRDILRRRGWVPAPEEDGEEMWVFDGETVPFDIAMRLELMVMTSEGNGAW